MNTGADDDSLSTPTLAFSSSSAWVCSDAIASRPANKSRAAPARDHTIIQSLRFLLEPFGNSLIAPDEGSLLFQLVLQFIDHDVTRRRVAMQRQGGGGAGCFAHRKARAGDARRGLAVMGHRSAAP